ncbi:hypothetical protein [Microlunatus flavus]|uniref:hypothetical protein n=1 Tax=Microlunatus flavus TaxID=1036181 RepID=UPI000B8979F1|nr:hypothetical protein [Microlunatus flavus]
MLVALLVIGLAIAGVVVILVRDVSQTYRCADPPSTQQRAEQEAFVSAHLPDASDFEWTVADCDDQGQASLTFTTRQRGTTATRAFLQDGACRASREPDASLGDVTCMSYGVTVFIYLEDHGAIDTYGELSPDLL